MAWASYADVTDRWVGTGAPVDEDMVNVLIEDAETIILSQYPKIQDRIDAGTLAAQVVKMVVVRQVIRVLRNPENLSYWQQQTGPFGQGRTFGKDSDIWLTDDELELLAPKRLDKAFSIDLGANAHSWVPYAWLNGDGYTDQTGF
jgi:hypothetical protein